MKFLVYSDFHGLFGMINHFKTVKSLIKSYKPDFIIFCGDFRNKISINLLNVRVKSLRLPVYYVWGNDDEVKPEFELRNGENIHLKLVNLDENLSLAGIGGDEYDVEWNIQKFDEILSNNDFKDLVIISHVPPYSACDLANDGRM
jgi:predicted phosphodiesterase